jgi:hypothetical protein
LRERNLDTQKVWENPACQSVSGKESVRGVDEKEVTIEYHVGGGKAADLPSVGEGRIMTEMDDAVGRTVPDL